MAITFPNATLADAPTTDVSPDVPPVANPLPGFVSPTSAQVTDPLAEQVAQPEEAPPVVDLSAGIPQSFVYRPPVEFSGGENPWDRDAREHAARMEAWREEETPKVNLMATDPDKAFKGMDLKWARSVKEGQRLFTNDAFMRLQLDGNDVPTRGLPRAMVRWAVANRMFDGKGGESEDAFHAQIIGHFQKLGFDDAIGKVLADNGQQAGIMQTAMPGAASNPKDWQMTRDAIQNMPGYSPEREADFHSMFHGAAMASRAMMQPFAPELREIWGKMKQGEQGTVSSTLVAGFRALAPTGDGTMPVSSDGSLVNPISAMATEAGKEDAAATAFRVYKAMPEDQRTEFMSALGLMAKSFPADERNGFFANMAKSGARAMDGLPREALSAFMSNMLSISDMGGTIGIIEPDGSIGQDGTLGGSLRPGIRFNTSEGAASQQAEFMARHNFSADVRRIQDEAFNPVLNTKGKAPGGLARAAYAFPGLMAFTAEAELPGIGLPLMFLSMQTQANDQLRQNLMQGGMKEEAASHLAGNLAPFVALPQAALMKANAGLWLGKLPMFETVFDRIGDQFTTTITRLGMRAAAADVTGQAIMEGMSLVPHITQQVVHALDSDVPDVQWGGKGGVFDGFWARTFEGMATLAPLAILGAAGGISADARAKAFAAATPKELAALGWKPDAIAGRTAAMAKGLSSMGRLIDVGMLGADPHSEGAQTAADELIREHMGKTLLAANANDSGLFPDLVHTRDGWLVKDRETGKELGQSPDISGAMKIVETHYSAFDDLNEHHVAYITSLMEAAQESRKLGGVGDDHSISMELDNAMTEAKMAMENPATSERFQKQVELKERLNGGDGSFSNAALGVAVPGHDDMGPEERLFQGADVTTTFHETFHRLRREARAAGRLTRVDEIAVLRSLDKVMGGKRTKEGPDGESEALRFLPDGIADADITDMMLDEGCGEIGSMQILKSRKGGGPLNIDASTRANPNFITRNLLSIAARVSPEAAEAIQKFTNFIAAVRARWSLAMQRSLALQKAERDGTFDKSTYEAYLNKLLGRDTQLEHEARVETAARDIFGHDLEEDNIPFATGRGGALLPTSPEKLHETFLDRIGESALRVEQPRARYEDKRQLLFDFSKSILGPVEKRAASNPSARLCSLQILGQKFAEKLATDLQVRFIGDTITDTDSLVIRAQALRNPLFETFYLLGLDSAGTLKGAMAVTSRVPCAATVFDKGQDWGSGAREHADFLANCGASEYVLLHNHPSGDPSPSMADIKITQRHAMELEKHGFPMREHLVINHLTYTKIDKRGRTSYGVLPKASDPSNVDPFTSKITDLGFADSLSSPEKVLQSAARVQENKGNEDMITGFIVNTRVKVVAILQGTIDQFNTLTPKEIQDFSREQGGVHLMISGVAKNYLDAAGKVRDLIPLHKANILQESVFELPGEGNYLSALENGLFGKVARFFGGEDGPVVRVQEPAFATGRADLAGFMAGDALRRVKDPLRRVQAMSRIARNFQDLKLVNERLELLAGGKRVGKSLLKEAAMREAIRHEELVGEVWGRHMGILSNDDLTKLKSQPGHEIVSDPSSPLRGRLMSWAAVLKEHPERFSLQQPGEYNGAEGINRSVFGGSNTPDQIAKEMFDAGLIRHNTPDAMWDLLRQEQNMVAKMKAYLLTAKDELREARQQARAETNDWLATQTANQKENYSPKKEILQALASMDAIMTALPPDIRGKLGGYTQMARLGSDEVRLEYLKDKLARADELLEKYLRGNYDAEFRDLLKRARPNKDAPGERPTGRITPEVQDMFREMEAAMSMAPRDVEAQAAMFEAKADHEDTNAAEAAQWTMTANLMRLAGNWLQASAARREQAFLEADRMFGEGFLAQKILYSKRAERQAKSREQLIDEANRNGTTGTLPERKAEEAKNQGIGGWAKNLFYGLFSFEHLLHHCFGENSPEAIRLADAEREAANRKSDALFAANKALDHLFTSLGGGAMGGEKLRYKLGAEKSIKIKLHSGEELSLTPFEAISATLMWRQEDGRRHMEGHLDDSGKPVGDWHYSQANMDSIEDQLPLAAKAVRLHLVEQYAAEYDRINAVYRGLYGMNLPHHSDYSPLTVKPQKIAGGPEPDPVSGFAGSNGGITPGSLKTRSTSAIAEPDFRDAVKTYIGHTRQMEHFIAYAGFSSEAKALLSRRDVGNPIKAAAGEQAFDVLRGWVDFFAQGGTRDAQNFLTLNQTLSKNMNRAASMALTGRVSVLVIQWLNLGSALAEMPTGSYLKRLALLTTGNLGWKDAFNSEYIQRRLQELPPVVRQAMEGLHSSKPNELTHAMAWIGQLIGGADAMFTAGTYAIVHDYQTKLAKENGLTGAEAAEYIRTTTERICDRISQPTRAGARSLFEATSTNPGMKLLWAFSSEPRQKMGYLAWQLMNKDASAGRKARAAAVTFLIGGALQGLTRSFLADIKDSKDAEWFDEKHWSAKRLALATFTSPFQGVPLLGDMIQQAAYSGFHEYLPEGNLLSGMVNAGKRVAHVPEWFTGQRDIEEGIKDAEAILAGIGAYNDTIAASASVAHLARDIYGTAKNATK